jgi:multidrug efflux pump subunit AcrB
VLNAVNDAVTEIALAVIATTMALVVVFLPTALMGGVPGLLFRQFGWTAVIAVLASLLVARLLTPMMAAHLLKGHLRKENSDGRLMSWYLDAVLWCLVHQKITAAAAVAFLFGSLALVPLIPMGFIPPTDSDFTTLSVELPPGSSLDRTLRVAEQARQAVRDVDGIRSVFTTVGQPQGGEGGVQAGEVRRASLTLIFPPRGERPRQAEIEAQVRTRLEAVPGARFSIGGDGGPGNSLQLILASDNSRSLKATAQALERELRAVAGLSNITTTASLERPEIVVHPDLQRAAEQGVTAAAIGEVLRIATSGDFDANVARLNLDNRQIYIRLQLAPDARRDIDVIAGMRVNGRESPIPLSSVASLSLSSGPAQIDRYDRRRYVTVQADLGTMPLGAAIAATMELPSVRGMPSSVELIESGDAEIVSELLTGFSMALVVGVLCIFCVLALLFKDFLQPITILSAIPLSFGGALLALLLAGSELGVPAMIGLVMLMGIVTKNSILLVEYTVVGMSERGLSRTDALMDACHKRVRPIMMTTVAMIAGMLPIALGLGADASFRQPMAIAVIGGLISSTALSLLVVPVVFTWMDRLHRSLAAQTTAVAHPSPTE